jgi:hypothetical protein
VAQSKFLSNIIFNARGVMGHQLFKQILLSFRGGKKKTQFELLDASLLRPNAIADLSNGIIGCGQTVKTKRIIFHRVEVMHAFADGSKRSNNLIAILLLLLLLFVFLRRGSSIAKPSSLRQNRVSRHVVNVSSNRGGKNVQHILQHAALVSEDPEIKMVEAVSIGLLDERLPVISIAHAAWIIVAKVFVILSAWFQLSKSITTGFPGFNDLKGRRGKFDKSRRQWYLQK